MRSITLLLLLAVIACGPGNTNRTPFGIGGVDAGCTLMCDGECFDGLFDDNNCGACGVLCPEGTVCSFGACECPSDAYCSGVCVDLAFDSNNCGFCGHQCVSSVGCVNGVCECEGTVCGDQCVDTNFDSNNCGGCGNVCPQDHFCNQGFCQCAQSCGFARCPDFLTDNDNCGFCNNQCGTGMNCQEGSCGCSTPGLTECFDANTPSGTCVDVSSDILNCGFCNQDCTGGTCANSFCTCQAGQTQCPATGGCVDQQTDPFNCGSCGNQCGPNGTCDGGACVCNPPLFACPITGSGCTDLQTDNSNCGSCGVTCHGGDSCTNGQCECAGSCICDFGFQQCGQHCANLISDPLNCGGCGIACPPNAECGGANGYSQVNPGTCDCPAPTSACGTGCFGWSDDPCITQLSSGSANVISFALDGDNVYWIEGEQSGVEAIVSAPKAGGTISTLATGVNNADGLEVVGSNLYWGFTGCPGQICSGWRQEMSMPTSGGTPATLATFPQSSLPVVNTSGIFMTSGEIAGSLELLQVPLAGGDVVTLATQTSNFNGGGMSVANSAVYWSSDGNLLWTGLRGGVTTTLVSSAAIGLSIPIIVADEQGVFWTDANGVVLTCDLGCPGFQSFEGGDGNSVLGTAIALDSTKVYVGGSGPSSQYLVDVGRSGGIASEVAFSGTVPQIAVDDTSVYWIGSTGGNGQLLRQTPK